VKGRPAWWLPVLVVLLVTVPIIEVWLLIAVGRQIGVAPTLAVLVGEALLGGWLLRREGQRAWTALNRAFTSGRMPTDELADGALVLVGGVLLLLPGFATDVVGLLCLLPFTRPLLRRVLAAVVTRRLADAGLPVQRFQTEVPTVIEGEVVESGEPIDRVLPGEVEDRRG